MENANAYRAIVFGTALLFGGCLVWLLISRNEVKELQVSADREALKYEALLAEKLIGDKNVDKVTRKMNTLQNDFDRYRDVSEKQAGELLSQIHENRQLKIALNTADKKLVTAEGRNKNLSDQLALASQKVNESTYNLKLQHDSIMRLNSMMIVLQSAHQRALQRSIDETMMVAERRNGKITAKARQLTELVAQVQLPADLMNLNFALEEPDGTVRAGENELTSRELPDEEGITAASSAVPFVQTVTRRIEIVYRPEHKLKEGTYVLKIQNGLEYIGSMKIKLQ